MDKNKTEIITFKVSQSLISALKGVPNRSEFIRNALLTYVARRQKRRSGLEGELEILQVTADHFFVFRHELFLEFDPFFVKFIVTVSRSSIPQVVYLIILYMGLTLKLHNILIILIRIF